MIGMLMHFRHLHLRIQTGAVLKAPSYAERQIVLEGLQQEDNKNVLQNF